MINPNNQSTININEPQSPNDSQSKEITEWKSCCYKLNPSMTKYFVQVSVLSGLIIFSSVMLVKEPECNSQRNYASLLMFCLGSFLPSPKMS
jgi:hypothetical protein